MHLGFTSARLGIPDPVPSECWSADCHVVQIAVASAEADRATVVAYLDARELTSNQRYRISLTREFAQPYRKASVFLHAAAAQMLTQSARFYVAHLDALKLIWA